MILNYSASFFEGKICSLLACNVITESKRKSREIQISNHSTPHPIINTRYTHKREPNTIFPQNLHKTFQEEM